MIGRPLATTVLSAWLLLLLLVGLCSLAPCLAAQTFTTTVTSKTALTNGMLTMGTNGTQLLATGIRVTNLTDLVGVGSITVNNLIASNSITLNGTTITNFFSGGGSDFWTNTPTGTLQPLSNGDTNVYVPIGPLTLGRNVANWGTFGAGGVLIGIHDQAAGDDPNSFFNIGSVDDAGTFNQYGDVFFHGDASSGNSNFSLDSVSGTNSTVFSVVQTPTTLQFSLLNNASPTFYVDPVTGYTGTGTNFFGDDGKFHAPGAGGGDTIWTNVAGVIQPASGQTTNTLSFTSGAADNATNVALVVDTAVPWTDGRLVSFRNAANEFARIGQIGLSGEIFMESLPPGTTNYGNISIRTTQQSPGSSYINGTSSADDYTIYEGSYEIHGLGNGTARLQLYSTDDGYTTDRTVQLNGNVMELLFFTESKTLLQLAPEITSTGSATAYLLDTSNVLTNGDKLVSIGNAGTERVAIQHDGSISLSSTTNRLGDDGTRLTYNASPLVTAVMPVACSDETTAITAGTAKVTFRMPFAATLTAVRASLTTAQTSGSIFTVDINESGTSVLSTKLTVDNNEKTSVTAATPAVISDSALADDAEITVDVDQIGNGTATGLKVELFFYQ